MPKKLKMLKKCKNSFNDEPYFSSIAIFDFLKKNSVRIEPVEQAITNNEMNHKPSVFISYPGENIIGTPTKKNHMIEKNDPGESQELVAFFERIAQNPIKVNGIKCIIYIFLMWLDDIEKLKKNRKKLKKLMLLQLQ